MCIRDSNNTRYEIKLIWNEEMIGDSYENEKSILTHEYTITHIVEKQTITEENTDVNILHKIKTETENRLKKFKSQQKQEELNKLLRERDLLDLDIENLQKFLYTICDKTHQIPGVRINGRCV